MFWMEPLAPPPSHHWGRKIFHFFVIIILLVLIGGGVGAYFVIFESPRAVLTRSFDTLTQAKSFHQDVELKTTMEAPMRFNAEALVASDFVRGDDGKGRLAITLTSKGNGGGIGYSAEVEGRFLDDTIYGRINEFPFLDLFLSGSEESPIGKWFSISFDELEQFALEQGASTTDITKIKRQIEKLGEPQISRVDTMIEAGVLVPGKRADITKVNGVWGRQYTFFVDRDKLATWALEEGGSDFPPEALESFKAFTFNPIKINVGLFDDSIQQISGGVAGKMNLTFTATYRDVGGDITVTKPDNAKSLIEYLEEMKMTKASSTQPYQPLIE